MNISRNQIGIVLAIIGAYMMYNMINKSKGSCGCGKK